MTWWIYLIVALVLVPVLAYASEKIPDRRTSPAAVVFWAFAWPPLIAVVVVGVLYEIGRLLGRRSNSKD